MVGENPKLWSKVESMMEYGVGGNAPLAPQEALQAELLVLTLLDRLRQAEKLSTDDPEPQVLAAVCVAAKVQNDLAVWASDFDEITAIDIEELKINERQLLNDVGYNVQFDPADLFALKEYIDLERVDKLFKGFYNEDKDPQALDEWNQFANTTQAWLYAEHAVSHLQELTNELNQLPKSEDILARLSDELRLSERLRSDIETFFSENASEGNVDEEWQSVMREKVKPRIDSVVSLLSSIEESDEYANITQACKQKNNVFKQFINKIIDWLKLDIPKFELKGDVLINKMQQQIEGKRAVFNEDARQLDEGNASKKP